MNLLLRLVVITLLLAVSKLSAATLYVGPGGFSTIQQAVNAALAGDEIVVTNGTYATDGAFGGGYTLANRVAVVKPLTLRSVNGPQVTVIRGYQDPDHYQYAMVRCVYLTNGASLSGFTLTGGGTYTKVSAIPNGAKAGGGVYCESSSATVSNCVLTGNLAFLASGACGGTLNNCTLANNEGGGAAYSTLNNCKLTGNSSGGATWCTLNNCLLTGNSGYFGGGATSCTLINCTVTGNSSSDYGGGVRNCTLLNCIVYFNTAARGGTNYYLDSPRDSLNYCCTTPLPTTGVGNITTPPLFVDYARGNLRLQSNSPCINAGNNSYVTDSIDLDGRPRIIGGTVDMGAYEFQPGISGAFIGWLQECGLPTDGSADQLDSDSDGMNNRQEWICGTSPIDPLSVLRMLSAAPAGTNVTVSWQGANGVNYFLERSTNLASPFTFVATNIFGHEETTTYTDTKAAGAGPFFYRVGVQSP